MKSEVSSNYIGNILLIVLSLLLFDNCYSFEKTIPKPSDKGKLTLKMKMKFASDKRKIKRKNDSDFLPRRADAYLPFEERLGDKHSRSLCF